eukprot:gnl/TRDRNA2_/TRDRNA2_139846_c1_seq1.p1 gnl/TRDRNA2_/TRDRNA2_139846_c1~~gnl/TRDRNA2_/TRDRNA2_139846_c1_seq1.p1  ORF type:complete len:373 (-),score=47.60 gnl/TRDRNA2_/TRDRNA2_139846_c1_seq1:117-1091(-)
MTNVAPHAGRFNRYSWRLTEEHLSDYVVAYDRKLLVVAGTAYDDISAPATIDGTAVPSYFWLAVCSPELKQSTAIYGRNTNVNTPEGMDKYISVAELLDKPFMQSIFPAREGSLKPNLFDQNLCPKDSLLDLGDRRVADQLSDSRRISAAGATDCDATGADLVMWRYVEGPGWEKAVSVKYMHGPPLNLETFSLRVAVNGKGWSKSVQFPRGAVIKAGEVFTVAHPRAGPLAELADFASSKLSFNGDDAVGLFECDSLVDQVGDPSVRHVWSVDSGSTQDHVLQRSWHERGAVVGCSSGWETCVSQWDAIRCKPNCQAVIKYED